MLLFIINFSNFSSAGLGLTPAVVNIDFKPNLQTEITYTIRETNPGMVLEIYTAGELSKYATLDKNQITGSGNFKITLNLPENIETPGKNRIAVVVKQKVDEELAGVGTSITIEGAIFVNVPYPGKYAEIELSAHNANVGEPVTFEINIENKGKETIYFAPEIDIYSQNEFAEKLTLKQRILESQEVIKLKKSLDTADYKPGDYKAVARINYGEEKTDEKEFRLGTLYVKTINYSDKVLIGGLQKFEIRIESNWNDKIKDVYANVSIIKNSSVFSSFKTSPTSLNPWSKGDLTGFIDSTNFSEGAYKADINLIYLGRNSSSQGDVEFYKEKSDLILILLIVGGIILLLAVVFIIVKLIKNGQKIKK